MTTPETHACARCGLPCNCRSGQAVNDCAACLACWADPVFVREIAQAITRARDILQITKARLS